MKKRILALCLVLVLALTLAPAAYAAGDYTTLSDWGIKVPSQPNTVSVLKGNEYYIYTRKSGSIPYVMITTYRFDSAEKFIPAFTQYMEKQHIDLEVLSEAEQKTIGRKSCWEIDYGYQVSGYDVLDRRIVIIHDGITYLFTSKEVPSINFTVGDMLEDVVAGTVFLSDGEPEPEPTDDGEMASAYLYCLDNGMPKYWLDFTGEMADTLVLHCYFRSGDPTFYETVYYLDMSTADFEAGRVTVHNVTDQYGNDVSNWFTRFIFFMDGDMLTMQVKRNPRTLAGGGEDNILDGAYPMEPAGAGLTYRYYKSGQLRYWLSGGDGYLEVHDAVNDEVYYLDLDSAQEDGDYTLVIRKVYNSSWQDVSKWFQSLTITEAQDSLLMNVKRSAANKNQGIPAGVYTFDPYTYLLPQDDGPFDPDTIGRWAQIYYFRNNGYFPPEADVDVNQDGTYTVHLYEFNKSGGVEHTATSAWYTVDAYGDGYNDITGESVSLCQ